ncbi:MAG: type II toxin-antitoxin system HicA family toxin [Nitrosopumilus sp.]|nr:type II toxin-antitoxin system HicA family toxin [Nitrosopumilus sp.]
MRNHSWNIVVKILTKHYDFTVVRQKGNHISLVDNDRKRLVVIPRHNPLKEPTLKSILDQAGVSKKDFIKHL